MRYIFILVLLFSASASAQRFNLDIYAGVANYQGDLQAKRLTFAQSNPAFSLGLHYKVIPHINLRIAGSIMHVEASDLESGNISTQSRNLSFKTRILEAQAAIEYELLNLETKVFTPYLFAGLAAFHFNPYALDHNGEKVYLPELGTEGQGLPAYPDKKEYKLLQLAVPLGAGIKTRISPAFTLGLEMGFRKLFTDYLDDVSTTYADSALLFQARGVQAVRFAYRGSELHGSDAYPSDGAQRGNPKHKDWYYTTLLRLTYQLGAEGSSGKKNNGVGCPVF